MSGLLMVAVVAVLFIAIGSIVLLTGKKPEGGNEIKSLDVPLEKKKLDRSRLRHRETAESQALAEKKLAEEKRKKELELYAAKKDLCQFLNHSIKMMNQAYRNGHLEELTCLEGPSEKVVDTFSEIKESLSATSFRQVEELWRIIRIEAREEGNRSLVTDPAGLKEWYLDRMLPFYETYASILDRELRYNSLLSKNVLYLFHELTGKKFRLGYKNHYSTGIPAYEIERDRYKVYDPSGKLLCDVTFDGRKMKNGYAIVPLLEKTDDDWKVYLQGQFKNGEFVEGLMDYRYQKTC